MRPRRDVDESRFDDFFLFDYARLVAAIGLVTGDVDVAGDAVDEACARAWERLRRGKEIDSLVAWVRVVALNVARGRCRRRATEQRARHRLATREPAPLSRTLTELPWRQREVVVLHYFVGLSIDDVAAELGLASGTVETSLQRARAALAAALGDTNNKAFDGIR